MSEKQFGKVVPFGLSAARMRRGADAYRKRGQPVEAVELLRRAAMQEDSATGWLRLAQQLRRLACYEQAALVLYQLCARADMPCEAWLELGLCLKALGRREAACDSLYHYLHEDPYSDAADGARDMLTELENPDEHHGAFRLSPLMHRALVAYRYGEHRQGRRRLWRAVRMAREKGRIYMTMGMLELAEGNCQRALCAVNRALKCEPENVRAMSMRCVVLSAMNHRRMALRLLEDCSKAADSPEQEDHFLTAAWTMDANGIAREYLERRLSLHPGRIALMHPMARLMWQSGRFGEARRWWRRILAIDPADMGARLLLDWSETHEGEEIPPVGALPADAVKKLLEHLQQVILSPEPPEMLLAQGSNARRTLDWCFTLHDESMQLAAVHAIGKTDAPCARQYLRELLTRPGLSHQVRQRALLRLAEIGEAGPMNMLMGQRITQAQLTPVKDNRQNLWKIYLPLLLQETRSSCSATEMAFFAADLWQVMTREQRHAAAGRDSYLYIKAMEILYLRLTEQEEEAARLVRTSPVSHRKLSRVLRGLKYQTDLPLKGEDIP